MKRLSLVVLSLTVLAFTSCGTATPPTRAQTIAGLTGVAATGQNLYMQQCVSCHGPAGDAMTASTDNKSMVAYVKANTSDAVIGIFIAGVPMTSMVSFQALSDQNLADIYAYVKNTLAK
jgi:mono/diheme cytochrome c family protein